MQVFKSYFKVLRKYIGQMILYTGILCGVMITFINFGTKNSSTSYEDKLAKFAVIDNDNSEMSNALVSYLETCGELITDVDTDSRGVQDAIYNEAVDCVMEIPSGFEETFSAGKADNMLDIITIPGSQAAMLFESKLDGYMNMMSLYMSSGDDVKTADARTQKTIAQKAKVSLADGKISGHSMLYHFYNYLGWTVICVMIVGVSPVLQAYNRKNLRARIECSPYRFMRLNRELVLGMMVTGLAMSAVFIILSRLLIDYDLLSERGCLFILNMLVYSSVALSLAFLVSKLTQSSQILSMCANIISLGMAFLCGIFVPREFLSDGVLTIAHFLPAYWYASATDAIDILVSGSSVLEIFMSMGIQILFTIVFILAGIVADRYKTAGMLYLKREVVSNMW